MRVCARACECARARAFMCASESSKARVRALARVIASASACAFAFACEREHLYVRVRVRLRAYVSVHVRVCRTVLSPFFLELQTTYASDTPSLFTPFLLLRFPPFIRARYRSHRSHCYHSSETHRCRSPFAPSRLSLRPGADSPLARRLWRGEIKRCRR